MAIEETNLLSLADQFYAAAVSGNGNGNGWHEALEGLAEVTGSKFGQLACFGSTVATPFNIITGEHPAITDAFLECGGDDPNLNPRINAGSKVPVLKVLAESDFITVDEQRTHPHYRDFAHPWDVPFICLTTLERNKNFHLGLAVLRSKHQGHIEDREKQIFGLLAPHIRGAVRTHYALEGQGATLLATALDSLSLAGFVCDKHGIVIALSPAAEALISTGSNLHIRCKQLCAWNPGSDKDLATAIRGASTALTNVSMPRLQTLVIRGKSLTSLPLIVDVMSLAPKRSTLFVEPLTLVVVRGANRDRADRRRLIRLAYSVTASEAEIALLLAEGLSPEAIAEARGVKTLTIRTQIKAIFAKMGVSRQTELVSRLRDF